MVSRAQPGLCPSGDEPPEKRCRRVLIIDTISHLGRARGGGVLEAAPQRLCAEASSRVRRRVASRAVPSR